MTIWKEKGWYRISMEDQEDVCFHESMVGDIEEALKVIKSLRDTWHFSDYRLDLREEV
ncbi:unnamed protein product [marine sediment metagenome]|uniref:Uncharacterized protein n=1 Tax=marine sediment metagenome TaxID=412755 RepID=X1VZN4_9ZZZZ